MQVFTLNIIQRGWRGPGKASIPALIMMFFFCSFSVADAQVEVTIPGQGKVQTIVRVENGVLGITNTYVRQRAFAKECVGACFYANTTKTKTWVCRNSDCNLDCSGREPVGGC